MSAHSGPADWWTEGTDAGRTHIATKGVVQDGLILNLDAGVSSSYSGSGTTWYDLSGNGAHCNIVGSPTHVQDSGGAAYWQFNSFGQGFESIDVPQTYKDLMILMRLETNSGTLSMAFGLYDNQDVSLRFHYGQLRSVASSNSNDWQFGSSESELFVNGNFNAGGTNVYNQWAMIRAYKDSTSPFRYEVSSQFLDRNYIGKIGLIMCYNRKLSDSEVQQNFNAVRGRFGI